MQELGAISLPIKIDTIASSMGAKVIYSNDFPSSISGFLCPLNGTGKFIIGINQTKPETHQRFTIAHELGHIVFKDCLFETVLTSDILEKNRQTIKTLNERYANIFATEILMPLCAIKKYYTKGVRNITSFCKIFKVSRTAMEIRLFDELKYNKNDFQIC